MPPRLGSRIHLRLEEAVGPPSSGLGTVHREIGVLEQLFEIAAVPRRHGDADARIGRDLMAEAFIGFADFVIDLIDEIGDVVRVADRGLDDREFVAAEPRDEIGLPDALAQPRGDALEQFVADGMPERVVDALELVDVDIENRELLATVDALELPFELLVEQRAIGQVGQGVVVGEMHHAVAGQLALGDVVDEIDQILRLVVAIADDDPPRGDEPRSGAEIPFDVVEEVAVGRVQRRFVGGGDLVREPVLEHVVGGAADDLVACFPELGFGDAVCEHIAAVLYALHRDLRRNVVDDPVQEGAVAVAFLFQILALGDVFVGRDPATADDRTVGDLDRPPVCRVDDDHVLVPGVAQGIAAILIEVAAERAGRLAMRDRFAERAAGLDDVGRQSVHLDVAAVADDQPFRGIEHQQSLRHVVDRSVEALFFGAELLARGAVLP